MKKTLWGMALIVSASLTACGGGSDSGSGGSSPVQGQWSDSDSVNLVTPDGELWGITGDSTTLSSSSVLSLQKGSLSASGSSVTGSIDFYSATAYTVSGTGTVSGTFVDKTSMTGSTTLGTTQGKFAFDYRSTYDSASSASIVAGTWKNTVKGRTITVGSDGAFTMSAGGCTLTGTITPDASGKNFYRLSGTYGTTGCTLPGASAHGVILASSTSMLGAFVFADRGAAFHVVKS